MRLIKRYSNRKLYDTTDSRYSTLADLAVLIRSGEEVKVVDNQSEKDLTVQTLAQIVFENQKYAPTIPAAKFVELIRAQGSSLRM